MKKKKKKKKTKFGMIRYFFVWPKHFFFIYCELCKFPDEAPPDRSLFSVCSSLSVCPRLTFPSPGGVCKHNDISLVRQQTDDRSYKHTHTHTNTHTNTHIYTLAFYTLTHTHRWKLSQIQTNKHPTPYTYTHNLRKNTKLTYANIQIFSNKNNYSYTRI